MAFDWVQFLNNAREQAGMKTASSNQESKSRTAISRAYYAALHLARSYLKTHGGYTPFLPAYSYRDVITHFMSGPEDTHQRIGGYLDRLFEFRKYADYEASSKWLATGTVQTCIKLAEKIIRDLDTL
jgi:uncharacterized protein (UPF0332 family)